MLIQVLMKNSERDLNFLSSKTELANKKIANT